VVTNQQTNTASTVESVEACALLNHPHSAALLGVSLPCVCVYVRAAVLPDVCKIHSFIC
jgi:hypothetical protein